MNTSSLRSLSLLFPLLLAACATTAPQPSIPNTEPEESIITYTAIPYPQPDTQEQIDRLGIQVSRLEQQIELLNTRLLQLERQPANRVPARSAAPRTLPQAQPPEAASQFIPNRSAAPAAPTASKR